MNKFFTLVAAALVATAAWAQATAPCTLGITDEASFAAWTVIDNNASTSANTWGYSSTNNEALYPQDKKVAADDWLISPAVTLEAGKTYDIGYYIVQRSTFSSDKQKYTITVGNAATVAAQTTVLAKSESFQSKLYSKQTCKFTPTESGTYYMGVHLYSASYMGDCGFQKFEISEGEAPVVKEYTIPYSEKFDSSASFDDFTTFNNDGTRVWTYYSSKQCAQFWGGTSADAWLITPDIKMQAGKTYKMTFNAGLESAVSSSNYKNLSVTLGQGVTAAAQSTKVWEEQIKSALMEGKECYFSVPSDGKYNVGFRVLGQSSSYAVFVDNILIEESVSIPAAATELTVTPAYGGQLKATISWVNPTMDKAGNALESISRMELKRGDNIILTLDSPEVGGRISQQDEISEAGIYTYTVVAYSENTAGDAATVTSPWIGLDTPKAVTDVVLSESGDYPLVTFTAPDEGVHGGYINTEALTYRIVRNPGEVTVAEATSETSFLDQSELALANYSYTVYAADGDQESEGATSNAMVFGGALDLPYDADMTDANHMALWTILDADANGYTWAYKNNELQYTSMKNADDYAFTPPFHTVAGKHHLQYRVKGYNYRYSDAYEVVLTNTTNPEQISALKDEAMYQVIETVGANTLQSSLYQTRDLDFEVPTSGIYYIGFHNVSTDSWGLYVGGTFIELTQTPTSVDDLKGDNMCYYDRASESLIVATGADVVVSAVNGMVAANVNNATQVINLSHLATGVYIATVNAGGSKQVVKFVK